MYLLLNILGTVDDEFKELNLTYVRIRQDTTKFLNECISYKAAMLSNTVHVCVLFILMIMI